VRTVSIDFWGTLMLDSPASDDRCRPARLSGMRQILGQQKIEVTLPQLTRAYEASGEYLGRVWSEGKDVAVVEHVNAMLRALDPGMVARVSRDTLAALVDAYARPLLLILPAADPGARSACTRLREAGRRLVLVSNTMRTPGTVLRQVLASLHLLDCFDHAVFSDEAGIRKPDPAIFLGAVRAVGGDPATTVHVGDDPVLDVQGARAAGIRAIQVVTGTANGSPADGPDRTIARLDELPEAVAALERS
jgi:putative hydrolase of the HAD superfamily